MNKYVSHSLAFVFGVALTGVASYITLGEIGKLFLIESLACTYFYVNSEQSLSEIKKETEEYFSKYYPQGNSPCGYHSGDGTNEVAI